ncbi:MAG TPA: protein kinase, partial [Kofleriaceae bacterium]|nr:protein kinase [Kofleriaceae bacterium]
QRIGEGGMGSVWLAEHVALGRRAALKVLHPEFSTRADIVARFFNEAKAATAIADPGIVQIFDFGQHVDGSAYIVMEWLDGEPLDRRLRRVGALALADGLRLMRQVASTLGAAHACGIIHRDLKPENIYVVRDLEVPGGERAKVLDFGIAKLVGERAGVKTQTAAVMGTPMFMSPEQCRGAGLVDQRSDVYALGCVLFTLVTGRPPFDADGVGDIIAMHLREPAPAPSQRRPGIPPEIDQLVLRCLAKDPAQRFASAGELAVAIGALLGSSPQVPTAYAGSYATARAPTTLSAATGARGAPAAKLSRVGGVAVLVGLGVIGIVTAVVATRGGEPSAPPHALPPATTAANHGAPASAASPGADPPAVAAAPPAPMRPSAPPDPGAEAAPAIQEAVARFVTWSHEHAGAPCPDAAALGTPDDPWGHSLVITCTEQPGNQIAGAISIGPDGQLGTADDIASWQLGRDITDLVRGVRWVVAPRPQGTTPVVKPPPASTASTSPVKPVATHAAQRPADAPPRSSPTTKPAPVQLDENGLPIAR